jgi:hypothetical protein
MDHLPRAGECTTYSDLNDRTIAIGTLCFHKPTRAPPNPPLADLNTFITANPGLPVVVDTENQCEAPVFATVISNTIHWCFAYLEVNQVGAAQNDGVIIQLFTRACNDSDDFSNVAATHFKGGKQYEGVDILDWSTVKFNSSYTRGGAGLDTIYRRIWNEIRRCFVYTSSSTSTSIAIVLSVELISTISPSP